jgi:hypothetical protein
MSKSSFRSDWPDRVAKQFADVVQEVVDDRHLRPTQFNGVTFVLRNWLQIDGTHCVMEHSEGDAVAQLSRVQPCDCEHCAYDAENEEAL